MKIKIKMTEIMNGDTWFFLPYMLLYDKEIQHDLLIRYRDQNAAAWHSDDEITVCYA